MTEPVLDVVSEDPQVEHIASDVSKAPVHEHRGQERQPNRYWTGCLRDLDLALTFDTHLLWFYNIYSSGDLLRDHTPAIGEFGVGDLNQEKHNIGRKQTVSNVWDNVDVLIVVAYRKQHAAYPMYGF